MLAGDELARAVGGRRLLQDCTPLGSVGVGGSIALLLLIGFVLGAGSSWLFFWWRQRRQVRIELEYRNRYGDAVRAGVPDVTAMVKAAHTPTIAPRGAGFRDGPPELALPSFKAGPGGSALAEGPLGMGVMSKGGSAGLGDPLGQHSSLRAHTNPVAGMGPMARSSRGIPFSEVSSFNVRKNEACSLNNTPSPPDRAQNDGAGLIGTVVFAPAADPASPRITRPAPAPAPSASVAAPPSGPAPSPFAWQSVDSSGGGLAGGLAASLAAAQQAGGGGAAARTQAPPAAPAPQHERSESVVVLGSSAAGGTVIAAAAGQRPAPSSDYLAALDSTATNPFEAPGAAAAQRAAAQREAAAGVAAAGAAATGQQEQQEAKAAQKQELLQQVAGEEYGEDELDPEWAALLADLDARLTAAGLPALSDRERAVAIRSLIVATASQSADAALAKAQHDVEAFRRAAALRAAQQQGGGAAGQ